MGSTVPSEALPSAWRERDEIARRLRGKRAAVFLDYDGTLTPIVARPELARLSPSVREVLRRLAEHTPVAILSGRDLVDLVGLVGLDDIVYAGSHGFEIAGPPASSLHAARGREYVPLLHSAEAAVRARVGAIPGVLVEPKRLSLAVHHRLADPARIPEIRAAVERVVAAHPGLRCRAGKRVFDIQPDIDWDKGRALRWLLEHMGLDGPDVVPLYIGDDATDEDAFVALPGHGVAVKVRTEPRPTAAAYALEDPGEVERFLAFLAAQAKEARDERLDARL